MKTLKSALIGILGIISFLLAIAEPSNEESWFMAFCLSKGLAVILGLTAYKLHCAWHAKGLLPNMDWEDEE